MNYFVLFSVILIAARVIVLLIPPTTEGFASATPNANMKPNANAKPKPSASRPAAAGQHNLSSAAGAADGGSSNQYLMDDLLAQQDRFMEAFENRNKTNGATTVSSTTTKKKGIASTGASTVTIPKAGCNSDKCVKIKDPMDAIDGNCVNLPLPNGEPDYSMKYCAAFQPKDYTIDAQECLTCGYYTYTGNCVKWLVPADKTSKCIVYGSYTFKPSGDKAYIKCDDADDKVCNLLAQQVGGGGGGDQGSSGPSCSTCQLDTTTVDKCVLPGCYSADDGNLPFPDDGDYNFAEGCIINKGNLPGLESQPSGYYCPPITKGQSYDAGGSSGDPCYTTNSTLDYAKFVKMDKICSNDKQKSKQQFVPGKDAPIDGNDMPPPKNTKHRSPGATTTHQHSGTINVYHHSSNQTQGKGQGNSSNSKNSNNTYIEPVGGATVLGYL
jgi:hypothetical protein